MAINRDNVYPSNDNATPRGTTPEWQRGANYYRPIPATAAEIRAVKDLLLVQPEIARKPRMQKQIMEARNGLQWTALEQWFATRSMGRAVIRAFLAGLP